MQFDNSYSRLPEEFYQRIHPVAVSKPELIRLNQGLAREMELDLPEDEEELAVIFSGNKVMEGMDPIAMAYAGHQFGGFVPQLGDGRAVLLGEVVNGVGKRFDIHLKGSGQTRFSRAGDGRSALGPVLREYIVSEAMYAMGTPTSRSLAMVTTGERVFREIPTPGGILTRIASGLVRVGTFEYFAARNNTTAVKQLADYVIDRHYPQARQASNPYTELFRLVTQATANLVAQWMTIGFIHGVMNTDNTAISGETIDYGPCAFMDAYRPDKVFSSIDQYGRYAYNQQPTIAQWNMAAFGGCLIPIIHEDKDEANKIGQEVLEEFSDMFKGAYQPAMCRKIGLDCTDDGDFDAIHSLMELMHQDHVDFTIAFRALSGDLNNFTSLFKSTDQILPWLSRWQSSIEAQGKTLAAVQAEMRSVNPAFIPRNHRIEQAIRAAEDENDFTLTHRLIDVLKRPYDDQPDNVEYMLPPKPEEIVHQTFCGT